MNVLFWIIMICVLMVFIVALFSTVGNKEERMENLMIAVVTFALMLLMNNMWR